MAKRSKSVTSARYRSRRGTRQKTKSRNTVKRLLVLVVVVGVGFLPFEKLSQEDPEVTLSVVPPDYSTLADMLDEAAVRALTDLGVLPDWIQRTQLKMSAETKFPLYTRTRVRVPVNLPLALCNLEVTKAVQQLGGGVIDGSENGLGTIVTLSIGVRDHTTGKIILRRDTSLERGEGKAAIIIDDFGESMNETCNGFLSLNQPLTLAVLPSLGASKEIAEQAHQRGFEVMLHLPMEPHNSQMDPGKGAISVHMTLPEIRARVQKNLESVPHIRGVNNHMGSMVTENDTVIEAVLREIGRKKLYWVDSRTSSKSKAYDVAKKIGLKATRSRLFLDNEPEIEKIRAKLEELYELTTTQDSVIAIGHCRPLTLQVLKKELPKLEKKGITFVYASELIE